MRGFGKRRSRTNIVLRFIGGSVAAVVLAVLLVAVGRASLGMYQRSADAAEARRLAETRLEMLRQKEERVSAAVSGLASPYGVEAEIRHRFGLAREGEGEIRIVRDDGGVVEHSSASLGLWERLLQMFSLW